MSKDNQKRRPMRSSSKEQTFSEKYVSFNTSIQIAGAALVLVAIYIAIKANFSGIKNLINANHATIKEVLTGDKPYLFYCNRGGKEDIYPIIFTDLNTKLGHKFGFASLNCSQTLPSGKTIFERMKLDASWRPAIFGTAPWLNKPIQATPNHMRDSKSFSLFVEKYFYPKATEIGTDKELNKICGFGKKKKTADEDEETESEMSSVKNTCIVIVKGSKYAKSHTDLEEKLIRQIPKAKICKLDGTKKRLSIEDVEEFPVDSFAMKVYAVRDGTHYLEMTNPVTWDYLNTFVSYVFATPLSAYSLLQNGQKHISLIKIASAFKDRSAGSQSGRSNSGNSDSKSKKPSSSTTKKQSSKSKKQMVDDSDTDGGSDNTERDTADSSEGSSSSGGETGDDDEEVIEL